MNQKPVMKIHFLIWINTNGDLIMTNFSFKAYNDQGIMIISGSDSLMAYELELSGFIVKRFIDGVQLWKIIQQRNS